MGGVPRVFQAIHKVIMTTTKRYALKIPFIGKWLIRKGLGWNKCKLFVSGSAPLNPAYGKWLKMLMGSQACVLEGFAMTETAALGFASTPGDDNLGHCGIPFDMVEIRLQSEPAFDCFAEDYILVD